MSTNLKINFDESNIYIPAKTMLMRFVNRGYIQPNNFNAFFRFLSSENSKTSHQQLDKVIVQVKEPEQILATAEVIDRMLLRRHSGVKDFNAVLRKQIISN